MDNVTQQNATAPHSEAPATGPGIDWDSRAERVQADQIAAYDDMRARCPVAHDEYLGYTFFRHADVVAAARDAETFSNHVSDRHIAVPNGMDAPEHTAFRPVNDKYFTPERIRAFEPEARRLTAELVSGLPRGQDVDIQQLLGPDFAMRITRAFMGWEEKYAAPLTQWVEKNRRATLRRDREEIGKIALEFDGYIRAMLEERRGDQGLDEQGAPRDVTAELLRDEVELPEGTRTMTDEEIVSLIRNWTVGELSTISACVGVVASFLATHPEEQRRLRENPEEVPAAVEEIMRLTDPLVSNRRVTTCPVRVGDRDLPAGQRVTLNWTSANRDAEVFEDALEYRPDRDQSNNVTYGTGVHYCPGAPLARLELTVLAQELLAGTEDIAPAGETTNEVYPVAGFSSVPVRIR